MVTKLAYVENDVLLIRPVDERKDIQIYLDRFPGSVAVDTTFFPEDGEYQSAWELAKIDVMREVYVEPELPELIIELDGNGDPVLDEFGEVIPVLDISGLPTYTTVIPPDPIYEPANVDGFVVNMVTARDIHRELLRNERYDYFKETDTLIMEAWSQRKDTSAIETRKAYLRNITEDSAIESATTTTELKAITIDSWVAPVVKNVTHCDYFRTEVDSPSYTLTNLEYAIGVVHTTTAAVTLTLPEISSVGHKRYAIKDEGGNAGTNNIVITVSGSDTIDGITSKTINTDYGSLFIYNNNGTGWFVV